MRSKLRMKKRTGRKKIIWFNSHSSLSVKTNIGIFLKKNSKKHFLKANPLSKIFNKNTKRISYSCTRNMKQHNLIIKLTSHAIDDEHKYIYIYIYVCVCVCVCWCVCVCVCVYICIIVIVADIRKEK